MIAEETITLLLPIVKLEIASTFILDRTFPKPIVLLMI